MYIFLGGMQAERIITENYYSEEYPQIHRSTDKRESSAMDVTSGHERSFRRQRAAVGVFNDY